MKRIVNIWSSSDVFRSFFMLLLSASVKTRAFYKNRLLKINVLLNSSSKLLTIFRRVRRRSLLRLSRLTFESLHQLSRVQPVLPHECFALTLDALFARAQLPQQLRDLLQAHAVTALPRRRLHVLGKLAWDLHLKLQHLRGRESRKA